MAIKLLRSGVWQEPDGAPGERLRLEGQAMARLTHPNVVRVFDVGRHLDRLFVAMELVEGATLGVWAARPGRTAAERLSACLAAGRGLAAAHAAGIVHRDVKPENVLVGDDGRVLVTDFGLARLASPDQEKPALVGTPAYLAPEVYAGSAADERSDQYGFAVTTWRVLAGAHPFPLDNGLTELVASARASRTRPPPPGRMSGRVRRVLERGLAPDPARRFPSMDALLAELSPVRRRRVVAIGLGAAVMGALAIGAVAGEVGRDDPAGRCRAAAPASAWVGRARTAVERAFAATGRADAALAFRRVDGLLGERAAAARALHVEACTATHDEGIRSPELFDRQMACLAERRREVAAVAVEMARVATAEELDRAVSAAFSTEDPARCGDAAALLAAPPPPTGPRAAAIESDLAAARAQSRAGRYEEARTAASRAVVAAIDLGHGGLSARAHELRGEIESDAGLTSDAEATLRAAAEMAARAGDEETEIRAWTQLAHVVGSQAARPAEGLVFAWVAELATERIQAGPVLRGLAVGGRANVLARQGDHAGALAAQQRALALFEQGYGKGDPMVGRAHLNICQELRQLDRLDEASAACARGEAVLAAKLGPDHHHVGVAALTRATVDAVRGDYPAAEAGFRRAVRVLEGALGSRHAHVALAHGNLANVLYSTGRYPEAEAEYRRAQAIQEQLLGPEHPEVVQVLHNVGMLRYAQEDRRGAEVLLRRVVAAAERAGAATAPFLASYLADLATVLSSQGKHREAIPLQRRALSIADDGNDPDGSTRAEATFGLAFAYYNLGQPGRARPLAERALAMRTAQEAQPRYVATARFLLAEILWRQDRPGERAKALAMARQAAAEYTSEGKAMEVQRREVEAWLAAPS